MSTMFYTLFNVEVDKVKRYHIGMRGKRGSLVAAVIATIVAVLFAVSAPSASVDAAINQQINFQGKLTNPDGTNVTNGSYTIRFRIYTDPSLDAANVCSANSCKWEDTASVTVTDGIFMYALGSNGGAPLPGSVDFNSSALYIGIKVNADAEMTPRVRLTAAPYAFNSNQLGGITSSGFVQLGQSATAQDDASNNSSVFINKTGASGNILQLQKTAADVFVISNAGNITATGTYNTNTFSSSALTFGAAGTATIQSAASQALNITGHGNSTFSTDAGSLSVRGFGGLTLATPNATASSAITIATGNATAGTAGNISIDNGTSTSGTPQINIGTSANARAISIGNSTSGTTLGLTAANGISLNSATSLSSTFTQTYSTAAANNAYGLSVTNSNSGAGSVAVNGINLTVTGTATSGGTNTNSALRFVSPSAAANNVYYGLNFTGTGYTDILRVGTSQIINGSGVVQSAGVSGTYTNAVTFNNASNAFTGTTYNSLSLTSAADGFTVAGGTTSRTLTVTGANITIGSTIQPTSAGAIAIQANGANAVNIATGTTGTQVNFGNTTSNPTISFNGSGSFGTTSGAVSLNGATTVTGTNTFSVSGGASTLTGASTGTGTALIVSTNGNANNTGIRVNTTGASANAFEVFSSVTSSVTAAFDTQGDLFLGSTGGASGMLSSPDTSAAATTTSALVVQTGNSTTSGGTGALTLQSGNATSGTSGTVALDNGSSSTGSPSLLLGATNSRSITIGNTNSATVVAVNVGTATNAFSVQGASSAVYMRIDGTSNRLYVGNPTPDTTAFVLVLDNKSTTGGDPTGTEGAMYYNTADNDFRAYQNNYWATIQPVRYAYLSADRASTSTTYADVTDLSFSVAANTNYEMVCNIIYRTAATTTGIKFALNGPATPNSVLGQFIANSTATALNGRSFNAYNGTGATTGVQTANTDFYGIFRAYFRNGANAGTLQLRYGTEVNTSAATVRANSYCRLSEL